ncbi:immune inhibitor A domain-containing protein [Promineifilum sp.]|uniref:immune inhibitor A domain-containing protein n=1 Tax=Promineifilum sp. TaxID=2664178 RepID=UPI0035B3443D
MNREKFRTRAGRWTLLALLTALAVAVLARGQAEGVRAWAQREARPNATLTADSRLAWQSVRMPPAHIVEDRLREQGRLELGADKADIEAAVQNWYAKASKQFYTGPNPAAYRQLLEREKALLDPDAAVSPNAFGDDEKLPTPPKNLLGVVVEFNPEGGEETFDRPYPVDPADPAQGCSDQPFTYSALGLGDDPPPGPADNFTFFKPGISVADYQSAFFETGPDAGYGVVRPDLGGIDLSGWSLNNYLAEMSRGTYQAGGGFLADPLSLPHAHEYYGHAVYQEDDEGNCVTADNSDGNYGSFAFDTLDALTAAFDGNPDITWSDYDANDDHIIDLLVIIHAGYAWQNGGGINRLSTSSSGFTTPQQIVGFGTPDDDSDDYFVQGFNVDPEQLDVGGIQEEFEHQFGLPDIYVTDAINSNSFWGAHSAGVWGGPIGGARPVGHNLWQDWVLGWRNPQILHYNDPALLTDGVELNLGRARYKPEGTEDGVIVRLPNGEFSVPNLAGQGIAWYSQSGDLLDNRVYSEFDLTNVNLPVMFSFDAWWDIEEDFDYGLIEFSIDDGATWVTIPDNGGVLTDEDPNDVGVVSPGEAWGLTGAGEGTLTFNLNQFAGEMLWIRFRYLTDPGVANPGWQVDNIVIEDQDGLIYANDLEEDFSDWTNEGWVTVPYTASYVRYYLMEWRDDNGFDASLNDPYQVVYASDSEPPPETTVDKLPATTPGLQISYRDGSQGFDYALNDALLEGQSIGAKFGHLVVESHFMPRTFDTPDPIQDGQQGIKLSGRVLPGDATFGLVETQAWGPVRLGYDPETGESVEVKSFEGLPPEPAFHDSYGYYPGLFFSPDTGFVYFNDSDASVVLPARGPYTTRVTDQAGHLLPDLFGALVAGFELGTGNPGDSHVHFGLHAEVLEGSEEQATVRLWNRPYEVRLSSTSEGVVGGEEPVRTTFTIGENIGGKIEEPLILVALPEGVSYVEGSGFGGLGPLGEEALAQLPLARAAATTYLAWRGDDIWTGASVEPFGFEWTAADGVGDVTLEVTLYRNGSEWFQTEVVEVSQYPYGTFLPVMAR